MGGIFPGSAIVEEMGSRLGSADDVCREEWTGHRDVDGRKGGIAMEVSDIDLGGTGGGRGKAATDGGAGVFEVGVDGCCDL